MIDLSLNISFGAGITNQIKFGIITIRNNSTPQISKLNLYFFNIWSFPTNFDLSLCAILRWTGICLLLLYLFNKIMDHSFLDHQHNTHPNKNRCHCTDDQWVMILTKNSQKFCHIIIYRCSPLPIITEKGRHINQISKPAHIQNPFFSQIQNKCQNILRIHCLRAQQPAVAPFPSALGSCQPDHMVKYVYRYRENGCPAYPDIHEKITERRISI